MIPTLNKPGKPNESPLAQSIKLAKTLRKIEPSEDIEIYTPKEQHHEAPAEKPKHKRFGPPPIETTACVYCERKFSQEASERHVPICRALYEKSKLKQGSSSTKSSPKMIRKDREGYGYAKDSASSIMSKKEELDMALKRRTQFQPPLPNQRKQTIASAAKINEASSFCHDCGSMFATPKARFCVECGSHR